jgi:hypothetical protein
MTEHARYSPSASERWTNCPGSITAAENLHSTQEEHNVYTAKGTVIHAMGEQLLKMALEEAGDWQTFDPVDKTYGDFAEVGMYNDEAVTDDMVEQALTYLRLALDMLRPGDRHLIEEKVYFSKDLFGTVDLILYNHERLLICDLKTGHGNMVSPELNHQLMTYAGIFLTRKAKVIPPEIHLAIIQPPDTPQQKVWVTNEEVIWEHMDRIKMAMDSQQLNAGSWCKWCPVRASCPELHKVATNAMSLDLDGLDPDQWAETLQMAEILDKWSNSVFDRCNQLAVEAGLRVPGWKLVERQGRKTWKNERAAEFELRELTHDKDVQIANPGKLRTPTQLKKELKGVVDPDVIDRLTHTPVRGKILVHEDDKRPAVETGENLLLAAEHISLFK